MNPRQWKKACKKAAAECERRWPGEYCFVPADGTDTTDAPRRYQPRIRGPRWLRRLSRRFAHPPKGTPLLVTKDYWGEVNIETALDTLKYRDAAENFDWEKEMMMREIHTHKVNPANERLTVSALDAVGAGGAPIEYTILVPEDSARNVQATLHGFIFQNGEIATAGVNGITHEALLAILIDRLECFQKGSYANAYNETALGSLKRAREALAARTRHRAGRGVEGTHEV